MKCHENRRMRKRRDRKFLRRLAEKRFARILSKRQGGKNLEYYTFRCIPKTVLICGRRYFSPRMAMCLVPNAKYGSLMQQLVNLCGDVTVTLPADLFNTESK